ncbi:FtsX-like permease family protein [bacterium]|nr:FtsX-like permease family protein [bacterium]
MGLNGNSSEYTIRGETSTGNITLDFGGIKSTMGNNVLYGNGPKSITAKISSGKDVCKIFLSEGIFIGLINFILSYITLVIISIVINNRISISVLLPGVVEAALMLALSMVVVILSTIIPIIKIARKKPIDAINNR